MKLLSCLRTALCLLGLLAMPAAAAYPEKPINMIIAFTAGGSSDVQARIMQKYWNKYAPQPWVFVYKPGAGGIIGFTEIAKARPDGYTIGGVDLPHIVLQPMLRPEGQPGYKTEQLNPLCCLVFDPDILIVSEKSPFKSFGELIEYAKANPGKVKAATVGKLTGDHIFLINVEKFTGAQFTQVPYPGGSKAAPALLGGEVDCYFASTSNFLRMQGARGLAIATKDRYELCPDVPTMNELGYKLQSAKYRGLATPPNFPAEAQAYLEAALAKVCADPEYQAGVRGAGLLPYYKDGKAFGEIIEQEKEKARKTLKEQGLIR